MRSQPSSPSFLPAFSFGTDRNPEVDMSAQRRLFQALLLLLVMGPAPSAAQTRERGPIVLELPASTRALALGNSFALGFSDSDAVFYHPGLLNRAQGLAVSLQRFTANGTLTALSTGRSWLGGGVALGVQQLSYKAPGEGSMAANDILDLPADEGSLREDGEVGVSESVISAGYGRTFMGARMGLVGKLVEQRVGSRKAGTVAVDLGLALTPGPITVGFAVQNLGPEMTIGGEGIQNNVRIKAKPRQAPKGDG